MQFLLIFIQLYYKMYSMETDDCTQARLYKSTIELIKKYKGHDSIAEFLDKIVKKYAAESGASENEDMKKIADHLGKIDANVQANLCILIEIASKNGFIKGDETKK